MMSNNKLFVNLVTNKLAEIETGRIADLEAKWAEISANHTAKNNTSVANYNSAVANDAAEYSADETAAVEAHKAATTALQQAFFGQGASQLVESSEFTGLMSLLTKNEGDANAAAAAKAEKIASEFTQVRVDLGSFTELYTAAYGENGSANQRMERHTANITNAEAMIAQENSEKAKRASEDVSAAALYASDLAEKEKQLAESTAQLNGHKASHAAGTMTNQEWLAVGPDSIEKVSELTADKAALISNRAEDVSHYTAQQNLADARINMYEGVKSSEQKVMATELGPVDSAIDTTNEKKSSLKSVIASYDDLINERTNDIAANEASAASSLEKLAAVVSAAQTSYDEKFAADPNSDETDVAHLALVDAVTAKQQEVNDASDANFPLMLDKYRYIGIKERAEVELALVNAALSTVLAWKDANFGGNEA